MMKWFSVTVISFGINMCIIDGSECHANEICSNNIQFMDITTHTNLYSMKKDSSHPILESGSSVWCFGTNHTNRICKFKNLCYFPEHDDFIFLHGSKTTMFGIPEDRYNPTLLDASSVQDHNAFYFNYIDLPANAVENLDVVFLKGKHLLVHRFHPDNIMHVIHDDILPVWDTLHMIDNVQSDGLFNTTLILIDARPPGDYFDTYKLLTKMATVTKNKLRQSNKVTCFQESYVGLSKRTIWYQYGFYKPQGPIADTKVTYQDVQSFSTFIRRQLKIESLPVNVDVVKQIALVSRKENRLILNENELINELMQQLQVRVVVLDADRQSLKEMIEAVSQSQVLIGIHGSLLILAMFLPPGSCLIELFPYAINAAHYTPFKTLVSLKGTRLSYKSWQNDDIKKTVTHPDYPAKLGGIQHLSKPKQEEILNSDQVPRHLCCSDPAWLFRIYQDTIVNTRAVVNHVHDFIHSKQFPGHSDIAYMNPLYPSLVKNINCQMSADLYDDSLANTPLLTLSWHEPWNVKYINVSTVFYEVWLQPRHSQTYRAWMTKKQYLILNDFETNQEYLVWLRCIIDEAIIGPFNSQEILCKT